MRKNPIFVMAFDSFKGSMSSIEAGEAAAAGVRRVFPDADIRICPMADGGEGTVAALVEGMHGRLVDVMVSDPLGRRIQAQYGIVNGDTAVIEMAAAAGLVLLEPAERDPWVTTTYGVGEMIRHAIAAGCRRFIIGIGGSATNDGGMGMLQALGFAFLDAAGAPVPWGTRGLGMIHSIRTDDVPPELAACSFHIACDVKNPLCGENGCSAVYGPQKGAVAADIPRMDAAMAHYASVMRQHFPAADAAWPGAGAAGGLGFAFLACLHGQLQPGVEVIIRQTGLEESIRDADIVFTGEGKMDGQTLMGKTPMGVAAAAQKYGKPVLAFAGGVTHDVAACNEHGLAAVLPIVRAPCDLAQAMDSRNACQNMADCVEQAMHLLQLTI